MFNIPAKYARATSDMAGLDSGEGRAVPVTQLASAPAPAPPSGVPRESDGARPKSSPQSRRAPPKEPGVPASIKGAAFNPLKLAALPLPVQQGTPVWQQVINKGIDTGKDFLTGLDSTAEAVLTRNLQNVPDTLTPALQTQQATPFAGVDPKLPLPR